MFISIISYNGRPRILHGDPGGQPCIVVSDTTPTVLAPFPQPGDPPKYIDAQVLIDAGMKPDDNGEYVEFLKPDGTSIKNGERYTLPVSK